MASPNVDIRKLKDEVAEFLRKQKYDKAAETLEHLVRAEPKDMQHRLKLGDTYRRLHIEEKAITCYQIAAKHFSDEGQLIKAIGAVKVILEIEPKNEMAQRELAQMNDRRFAKPTMESAGLRAPKGIGSGARGVSALELAEGERAAADISSLLEGARMGSGGDDEPLELDDGPKAPMRAGIRAPIAPVYTPPKVAQKGVVAERSGPPGKLRPSFDLSSEEGSLELDGDSVEGLEDLLERDGPSVRKVPDAPKTAAAAPKPSQRPDVPPAARLKRTGPEEVSIDLEPELSPEIEAELEEVMELPDEAIVAEPEPAPKPKPAPRSPALAPPPPRPAQKIEEELELDFDLSDAPALKPGAQAPRPSAGPVAIVPPPPSSRPPTLPPSPPRPPPFVPPKPRPVGPPQPIADLLSSEAEEEIELLSISSDQEVEPLPPAAFPAHPAITTSGADLDAAFGAIDTAAPPPPAHKVPAKVPLFDDLSQEAFVSLVNKLSYKLWAPGEQILKEGEPGRSFFVIIEGKVRVFKRLSDGTELQLAELGEGAFFGEMALLSGAPRTANVAAVEDTELLEITDTVLREVVEAHPVVATSLKNFYRQRLLNNVMTISPMFKDFDAGERKSVVERFKMRQATAGEVLVQQGKPSDGLYVVLHGQVRVVKKTSDDADVELARLKEGDIFGEMSLLTRKPATATVTAIGNTIVLKLPRENFQELILTHPQILELVSELTEKRKSNTEAVLSGHGPGHDGMSFV